MNQPGIEEKLKAIEAALNLAEARNLPAVLPTASLPEDPRAREKRESRDLAIAVLQKMEKRIADLESEKAWQRQQQAVSEAMHQEEREAIEVISGEVATLKKRTAAVEQWARHLQVQQPQEPYLLGSQSRPSLIVFWLALAGLGLLVALVLSTLRP